MDLPNESRGFPGLPFRGKDVTSPAVRPKEEPGLVKAAQPQRQVGWQG